MSDHDPALHAVTGPLEPADAAGVRALADAAARADGVPPLSEQPLLWLTGGGPGVRHLLAHDVTGDLDGDRDTTLVGYAQVDLRDPALATAEVVVHPDHRRRGTGSALLDAARDAVRAAGGAQVPGGTHEAGGAQVGSDTRAAGGTHVDVWAHGDVPAARVLAAARGWPVVRELWQMALDPLVVPAARDLPAGLTVRTFEPGRDEDAWVRLNARAFAAHPEQGRLTRADLADRTAEPWFDPAGLLLAESGGRAVAYAWAKVSDPGSPEGEVYALGVDPDAQGQGLGPALTARLLAYLAGRGITRVVLYTEGDNHPAIHVYRAAGFARSAVDVVYRVG